jgi:hypothetical protein
MFKKLSALIIALSASVAMATATAPVPAEPVAEPPAVQVVCIDRITKDGKVVIDPKTGKPAQDCRKMRVRKKLEGTVVPPAGR